MMKYIDLLSNINYCSNIFACNLQKRNGHFIASTHFYLQERSKVSKEVGPVGQIEHR